ncbi:hypothetical protein CJF42_20600 [Pseudoalteromonas sp. NBT06-2]|uniref:tetratricopeptide repeat protein n=1 Tax=Pseudoalteromonas sp. NBT06-2 TaxID=2025950 RepID=UPI000BA68023|nr:tetratricopeptide repeat protein [Pseudoalteromonas sp. NBT06-2]PAJ72555.1 hypothetical protein CJF42_20600 [Pseudoalteromonas sp. NBT06-2]
MFQFSKKTLKVIIFLSIVINSGCQSPPDKIKHELSDTTLADIALQSGDMRSAISIYQKLLTEDSKEKLLKPTEKVTLLVSISKAYRALMQSELAIHYLLQAKSIDPKHLATNRSLGLNYLDQQQYKAAIEAFSHALQSSSLDTISLNGIGVANSWLQQYESAHKYLMQAQALKPGNIEYKNNLALNHILQKHYKQAIKLLLPIYQQQASTAKIRNNLAMALTLNGNQKYARKILATDFNKQQIEQNIQYFHFSQNNQSQSVIQGND